MAARKIIYFVRHGKILIEGDQRSYIGQADVALDPGGVRQFVSHWTGFRLL